MSVISNQTHFNISNNSSRYLELTISTEQNHSFRIQHNSSHISELHDNNTHDTYASWLVDSVSSWTKGSAMQTVRVNLPVKETIQCQLSCTSTLVFTTRIKDRYSSDHNDGEMIVPPEFQGGELHIIFTEAKGLGYTKKGDVAVMPGDVSSQSVMVMSQLKTMDGVTLELEDNGPALCKSSI